ncbi:RLF transduction protein [Yersinia phage vB_YenM_P778]
MSELDLRKNPRYQRWSLSLSILIKENLFLGVQLMAPENSDKLRAVLYKYGMDIDKHYDMEILEHRNEYGQIVMCPLFMGIERLDDRWKFIKSLVRKSNYVSTSSW